MDEQLISLYHRHVAMAFDRQLRFADFLERKAPREKPKYDTASATLAFGKVKFEAPVLGFRQEHNNSWLWAWSDRNLKLTITNRALGDAVRMLVHRLGVHALAAPGFSLEPLLGSELAEHAPDVFGVIFTAELGYDAYHLTDRGQTTVLVRDDRLKFTEKHPLRRVLTVFPQVIAKLPVLEHKAAFTSYAREYGLAVAEAAYEVLVTADGDSLTATFDDRYRLIKLEGTVAPEEKKPVRKTVKKPAKPAAKKPTKPAKKLAGTAARKTEKKPARKPAKPAKKPGKKR